MDDKMYPGMSDDEASPSETPDTSEKETDDKEEGETALLPRSLFGGADPKPGEEYIFEVVRSYDGDEIEIKYAPKNKEEGKNDEADGKLDAMGTEMGGGY
jgi:hypothetical protein